MSPAPSTVPPPPEGSELTLRYDGENYQGTMPARELAGVLASLADLAQGLSAADVMPGERPSVRVDGFQAGSFDVPAIIEALAPGGVAFGTAAAIGTAFSFYWKNMRRVVTSFNQNPDRGSITVTFVGGEVQEWTEEQWRLYNSRRAKKAMRGLVAPLRNGATLTLQTPDQTLSVPPGDAHLFEAPDDEEPADEERRFETWVSPDTVSFDPTKKWRLSSRDTGSFAATIQDRDFARRVRLGAIRVGRNDLFKVALRTVTTKANDDAPRTSWFIERVLDQRPGAEQDELPEDDGAPSA